MSDFITEMEWLNTFGDNLKDILRQTYMTQRELADAAGLAESTISSYIRKQKMPTLKAIVNIAYALNVSVDELVFNDIYTLIK